MTEAERERAEIVAWLREQHDGRLKSAIALADAIEALAHKDAGNG